MLTTNRTEEVRFEAGRRWQRDTRGDDDEEEDEEGEGLGEWLATAQIQKFETTEKKGGKKAGGVGGVKSGRRKVATEDERRRGKQGV